MIQRTHGRLVHELSFVHANVGWLLLFECGFVHKHSGEGKSGSINERLDSVLQSRTTGQDSWQNAYGLGGAESHNDCGDRPLQRCSVALRRFKCGCTADYRLIRDICWKRNINRPAVVQRLRDQSFCFVSHVLGCHDGAGTNDFFSHLVEEVEFTVSQRVVDKRAPGLGGQIRHSDQVENRHMLGVGSGDSIDSAQFTYTVSRVESSDAVNASVPVGRIRCVQFVAASDPVDTRKTNDCILNGKGEVPSNAENFGYSEILEPRQNVVDYGGRRCFLCWG